MTACAKPACDVRRLRAGSSHDLHSFSDRREPSAMNEVELAQCRALLGVDAQVTAEALKKVYVQKSYALIRQGASEAEREELRAAHATLVAFLDAKDQMAQSER